MALVSRKALPGYGNGEVELDSTEFDWLDRDAVVSRLRATFLHPGYSPPRLPDSALKLLELTKQSDVPLGKVSQLLEADPMMAAEVLKIAQSSMYAGKGEPVRTLEEAVVRLGVRRMTDIFLQASLNLRVFRVKGYQRQMEELRRHSVVVSQLARHIGRMTSLYDEHLFLCGLLHDVGIAAALLAIAESNVTKTAPPLVEHILPAVLSAHEEAGGILSQIWQLPAEVGFVVAHHHSFMVGGRAHPVAATVELAGSLAAEAGANFGQEAPPEALDMAKKALAIGDRDLEKLRILAKELAESTS